MDTIVTLERLHQEWKLESLESWKTHAVAPEAVEPLQKAIQANAGKRRRREAKAISILGLLIDAWKNQVTGGWALLCSGPGLYSDLRILRECRVILDEHETIEAILEGRTEGVFGSPGLGYIYGFFCLNADPQLGNTAVLDVAPSVVNSTEESTAAIICIEEDNAFMSPPVEPTPNRRQSGRLRQLKHEESQSPLPTVTPPPPPLAPFDAGRSPYFVTRPDTLPARALTTRYAVVFDCLCTKFSLIRILTPQS